MNLFFVLNRETYPHGEKHPKKFLREPPGSA